MQISKACNNIKVSGDCLKCNVMYYLYKFLVLNYLSEMREKEPLECRRMHIWALKTQKLPGPLSGPWIPAAKGSLRSHDSALLHRQLSASEAGAPLDKILDPHLGPQVLRPKVADIAKWSRVSEVSNLRPGSRAHLRALEAFGFLMLKYAFSHILETLFL